MKKVKTFEIEEKILDKRTIILITLLVCLVSFLSLGCSGGKYSDFLDAVTADKRITVDGKVEKINVRGYYPYSDTVVYLECQGQDGRKYGRIEYYLKPWKNKNIELISSLGRDGVVDQAMLEKYGVSAAAPKSTVFKYDSDKDEITKIIEKSLYTSYQDVNQVIFCQIGEKENRQLKYTVLPYYFSINTSAGQIQNCIAVILEGKSKNKQVSFFAPGLGEIEIGALIDDKYKSVYYLKKYGNKINGDWYGISTESIEKYI
ncbi:MAG: hypothetical protein Q4D21_08310 [Phascolarctobacterium sp.]|nr:hypothetical protein [Phascolarctobacterium sp.]